MTQYEKVRYPWPKWIIDKLIPLLILLILSPALLVVGVGMALNMLLCPADRGSWFYRERRISRGKEFDVLKFRVLREDILAEMWGQGKAHARLYEADLNNLTWAGRYLLKKYYFDELPQLFNILKGDMSLVGPRPWPLELAEKQRAQGQNYRYRIHAGWTGPAQLLKGHPGEKDGPTLDLEYVDLCQHASGWRVLTYDLHILRRTIEIMLEGKGLEY